jgi:hypothetical protein
VDIDHVFAEVELCHIGYVFVVSITFVHMSFFLRYAKSIDSNNWRRIVYSMREERVGYPTGKRYFATATDLKHEIIRLGKFFATLGEANL